MRPHGWNSPAQSASDGFADLTPRSRSRLVSNLRKCFVLMLNYRLGSRPTPCYTAPFDANSRLGQGDRSMFVGRWMLWIACVLFWTYCLVSRYPVDAGKKVLPDGFQFPSSKILHVTGYAGLTILAGWLHVRGWRRWLLVAFLALHGIGTEIAQLYVPERHGSPQDVGLDWIGIALGIGLSWAWWRLPARQPVVEA